MDCATTCFRLSGSSDRFALGGASFSEFSEDLQDGGKPCLIPIGGLRCYDGARARVVIKEELSTAVFVSDWTLHFSHPFARSTAGRCPDLPSHAATTARSVSGFGMCRTVSLPGQVELI